MVSATRSVATPRGVYDVSAISQPLALPADGDSQRASGPGDPPNIASRRTGPAEGTAASRGRWRRDGERIKLPAHLTFTPTDVTPNATDKPLPISTRADAPVSALAPKLDPECWVDEHGDYLFHYALSRLRDPVQAEDFVQETLLAALKAVHRFEGRSSERSWLTGILKNKMLDHFRKAGRETTFTDLEFYQAEENATFRHPDHPDHWTPELAPSEWTFAGEDLDYEHFWKLFHHCASKLPERISRVFLMREVDELPTEQICETLSISPNNLWVMLHRARLALRRCLELNGMALGKSRPSKD